VGADTRLRVWRLPGAAAAPATAAPHAAAYEGHDDEVKAVARLSDGRLVSGGRDTALRVWPAGGGAESAALPGHTHTIFAIAPLPGGGCATGSGDMCVRLWRCAAVTGRITCAATLKGHKNMVFALAASPDGARLLSGSADKTLRVWALGDEGTSVAPACERVLSGHTAWVNAVLLVSPSRAASASTDGSVRLWDLTSGACTAVCAGHDGAVLSLALLRGGERLASGGDDGALRLWRLPDGAPRAELLDAHDGPVRALVALPDGRLASGGDDRIVRLWSTDGDAPRCDAQLPSDDSADSVYALAVC
jgi:WD40 repeat protein